jgi:hypothetical protein
MHDDDETRDEQATSGSEIDRGGGRLWQRIGRSSVQRDVAGRSERDQPERDRAEYEQRTTRRRIRRKAIATPPFPRPFAHRHIPQTAQKSAVERDVLSRSPTRASIGGSTRSIEFEERERSRNWTQDAPQQMPKLA